MNGQRTDWIVPAIFLAYSGIIGKALLGKTTTDWSVRWVIALALWGLLAVGFVRWLVLAIKADD